MWNALIVFYVLITITIVQCSVEITTNDGIVKGRIWTSQKGRRFVGFTGIPFAKPPIGKLRFQAPEPSEPWNGILDATKSHNHCPQAALASKEFKFSGNEDCLYLNVYKPLAGELLPVMFYIHGGGYRANSGRDDWLGPEILLDKDIVLVVVNYRLGALGFLSTEDVKQPGNNGLKDQAIALKWVKDNIKFFGGDDSKITIFGNSVGGSSSHYFTMSPMTKDLIASVILQSGTGTTGFPFLNKGVSKAMAKKMGLLSNCPVTSTEKLINCLQDIDVADIMKNEFSIWAFYNNATIVPFQPVIEVKHPGAFLSDNPIDIVKSKKFANVPIVLGITEAEGASRMAKIYTEPGQLQKINDNFEGLIADSFPITHSLSEATIALRKFYIGDRNLDNSTKKGLTDMFTDGRLLSSLDLTLHLLLKHKFTDQPIYVYLFGFRGSISFTTLSGDLSNYGACHTDELFYLLPRRSIFPNYKPTPEDLSMVDELTNLWVNFAKVGNPTPVSNTWKPLKDEKLQYLYIKDPKNMSMKEGLFPARRKFWRENIYHAAWVNV